MGLVCDNCGSTDYQESWCEVCRSVECAELQEENRRLREDVVWQGGAVVRHEDKMENGNLVITAGLHFDEIMPGWLLNVAHGQRVQVTVGKVGGETRDASKEDALQEHGG